MIKWSELDDCFLRNNFQLMPHKEMALILKRSRPSVRNRCWRLGLVDRSKDWSDAEIEKLKDAYSCIEFSEQINLSALAFGFGRSKANVCRKARSLGLTNISRVLKSPDNRKVRKPKFTSKEERSKNTSEKTKKWIAENGHPRGALGMKHSEETKKIISDKVREMNSRKTGEEKSISILKAAKTREKNGTQQNMNRTNASWGSGWREIGGIRKYYRSKWEANYARYLEWLKSKGEIQSWLHEPETFWFDGIKRGCLSYLPDFRVVEKNGAIVFHEVKGWMDDRSKTKIKRMAKYHPSVKLIVIESKAYASIKKIMQPIIKEWEVDAKGR